MLFANGAAATAIAVNDEGWEYPYEWGKQLYITELMSLKDGRLDDPYPKETRFMREQMLSVLPSDVKAYLNWKGTGASGKLHLQADSS